MSRADPYIAPPIIFKPEKFPVNRKAEVTKEYQAKLKADAIKLFGQKIDTNINRMKNFVAEVGIKPKNQSQVVWDDVRNFKVGKYIEAGRIDKNNAKPINNKVGIVITSPPYIAAQKYIRTTKLELAWLGLATENEIVCLDEQTIGSERIKSIEKNELIPVGINIADSLLKKVYRENSERAAIASRYYCEMRKSLISIHKALKPEGYCILVIGNNTINKYVASNHKILSKIAEENGMFSTELILRDSIRSHGMITKRHETAGVIDDEYVIILKKGRV